MSKSNGEVTPNGSDRNDSSTDGVVELEEYDSSSLPERPTMLNIERHRSCDERELTELRTTLSPDPPSRVENYFFRGSDYGDDLNPPGRSDINNPESVLGVDPNQVMKEAWDNLRRSLVHFRGRPIGTIAALDSSAEKLNYDQVFVRDFVPSALAFLMSREPEIVKNFLLETARLQSMRKTIDNFQLAKGVMPASFQVLHDPVKNIEKVIPDFGETAIGRVAPVDSGFWWIILLRAYTKSTGDPSLRELPQCQRAMRLILSLCLSEGFDTFPTLLCADGSSMIDRRMGVYGYPIEIQALFFMALKSALLLLNSDAEGNDFTARIEKRLESLTEHMRNHFWLDKKQLNVIYRYKTEEYSLAAVNKFNVMPDSLPGWVFDFMPTRGGYFLGNVGPSNMDFRWFCLGNCIAIISSLATREQSFAIMDLIESRFEELIGDMPLKVCYPAIEGHDWRIVTGCDNKNTRWSYHNGGSWPVLLWLLTAACIKTGRPQIARRAIEIAELRLSNDNWPEYYDGKRGRLIGKQARRKQTWSIAGYIVSKLMLEDPSQVRLVALTEDKTKTNPEKKKRSNSWTLASTIHQQYC